MTDTPQAKTAVSSDIDTQRRITLTYGDGSTTELNNEIMEGTTSFQDKNHHTVIHNNHNNNTNSNDSFVMMEENFMIFPKSSSIATLPNSRPTNTAKPGRARRRGTESPNIHSTSGTGARTPTTAAPKRRRKRRSSHESKGFPWISSRLD